MPTNGDSDSPSYCNEMGDLAEEAGDKTAARNWYERGLSLVERFVAADPDNFHLLIDLRRFCEKLGDLADKARDSDTARAWFERGMKIEEALWPGDPSNVNVHREPNFCLRLGGLAQGGGDTAIARAWFERGLKFVEQLQPDRGFRGDPRQYELSNFCLRLGDLAEAAGDTYAARELYARGESNFDWPCPPTDRYREVGDFDHASAARICLEMGELALAAGSMYAAKEWFERGGQRIFKDFEPNQKWGEDEIVQECAAVCCDRLGEIAKMVGDAAATRAWFKRAEKIKQRLAATDPGNDK